MVSGKAERLSGSMKAQLQCLPGIYQLVETEPQCPQSSAIRPFLKRINVDSSNFGVVKRDIFQPAGCEKTKTV